jgi:excisionase family DNA binding protein
MRLLTATEVANILQVSKARVYELARTKAIPSITLGVRQLRFSEASLREFVARGSSESSNVSGGTN